MTLMITCWCALPISLLLFSAVSRLLSEPSGLGQHDGVGQAPDGRRLQIWRGGQNALRCSQWRTCQQRALLHTRGGSTAQDPGAQCAPSLPPSIAPLFTTPVAVHRPQAIKKSEPHPLRRKGRDCLGWTKKTGFPVVRLLPGVRAGPVNWPFLTRHSRASRRGSRCVGLKLSYHWCSGRVLRIISPFVFPRR